MDKYNYLKSEIDKRKKIIKDYILNSRHLQSFSPIHIHDAVLSYVNLGGKSLRPTVLLLSCGAVGGNESVALPAAAAVEIYHTWTLVHDDVIDNDSKRRNAPTVHTEFAQRAMTDLGWQEPDASHYGVSIAMLTGDVQQGWSWSLFSELYFKNRVDPALVLGLVDELCTDVQTTLVDGETLDIQYSKTGYQSVSEDLIVNMLWKKTAVLYRFAARAGAAIGLMDIDKNIPVAKALSEFCSKCGTAFQIQDDILGIIGDEEQLGKPVGSDIREGKRTLLTLKAFKQANEAQWDLLERTLGNSRALPTDVEAVIGLMRSTGAIDYAKDIAKGYVNEALQNLDILPESKYKELLELWAGYLIEREF